MAVEWINVGPFAINVARVALIADHRSRAYPEPMVDVYFARDASPEQLEAAFHAAPGSGGADPDIRLDGETALQFLAIMEALREKTGAPSIARRAEEEIEETMDEPAPPPIARG